MTDKVKPYIHIDFDEIGSTHFTLDISDGVLVEQIAMAGAKLAFMANHWWGLAEMQAMAQREEEKKQDIFVPDSGVIKPL